MNSKSTNHTCSNRRSRHSSSLGIGITGGPFQEQRVASAVDQPTLVTESEPKDLRVLQFWPDRVSKPPRRRRKDLVTTVLLIGEQPHPLLDAVAQPDLLGAGILVLLTIGAGAANR